MPYPIVFFFYRIAYYLVRIAFFFYYRISFEGRENVPKGTAVIFASNHRSYLDPVLVAMAAPHPFNFIAKEPLFRNPVFGGFIRLMGAFPTADAKHPDYDMLSEATKRLEKRRHLTIFPEGTRHTDGKVGRGKSGVCVLAARSGKPVVPIGLVFDSNNLHFRSRICVRVGKPLYAADYGLNADSTPHEMHAMRKDIMDSIKSMVEENPPFPILHDVPKHRTSIEIAQDKKRADLEQHPHVATLGPIIHNQNVVDDLTRRGARIVDSIADLQPDECVVIRSHGVSAAVYDQLEQAGNPYVDATCPFVAKIHRIVEEHTRAGDFILIAGDANHPEVAAIVGHCKGNCFVFESEEALNNFFQKNLVNSRKRLAIVAQTTYNILVWEKCLKALPKDNPNIMVYDTICHATQVRQSDADKLSRKSDLMIIVGGRHSSNTVKLYHVCNRNCRSYHIENSDELYTLDLGNAEKIGITAGASTPAHIIKEVQQTMTEIMDNNAVEEDINFAEALDQSFKKIHTGEKVKGTVCSVNDSEAIVDVGTKHTGYVPRSELTDDASKKPSDVVAVGDVLDLIVTKINDQEGIVTLSKKKVDEMKGFEEIIKAKDEEAVLEGTVSASVKGGVIINYAGVRVFIPASQSGLPRGAEMDSLVKTTQRFVILEVNEHRRRAVGSIKAVLKAEKDAAKEAFWETAEVGKTYKGEVKSLTSYGAFVDLGGIDGMVHISELSWKRIKHPSEVVKVGDYIEVYIKDLDKENNRISLGYKKQEDNPWEKFKANYKVGDEIDATIVSITPFGAFAQIIDGVDGLIHISQLADKRVENVKDIVSVGDVVRVKIIDIDIENKRISISMRALLEENNDADYED